MGKRETPDAAFYVETFGNVFKNGKPNIVINSNHNSSNAGGSHFFVFEFDDTLRSVIEVFHHHWSANDFYFKDTDGDGIPEVGLIISFQYTEDDCTLLTLHFQDLFLKFLEGNMFCKLQK